MRAWIVAGVLCRSYRGVDWGCVGLHILREGFESWTAAAFGLTLYVAREEAQQSSEFWNKALPSAGRKWRAVLNSHLESFMGSYWGKENLQKLKSEIYILYTFCIGENVRFSSRGFVLFFKLARVLWNMFSKEYRRNFQSRILVSTALGALIVPQTFFLTTCHLWRPELGRQPTEWHVSTLLEKGFGQPCLPWGNAGCEPWLGLGFASVAAACLAKDGLGSQLQKL